MAPYLYEHQNPHAPRRANGVRFWGYPKRTSEVRLLVVHTAENTPDYVGEDGGAEAVARFQASVERPSSYHELVDSDSHVVMLPLDAVAFGAKGANADGWHLAFATRAHLWPNKPRAWIDATLSRGAGRLAAVAELQGVPLVRLSRAQIADGRTPGVASHADTEAVFGTPGRRSDPGNAFPWTRFIDLARRHQETDMTPKQIAELAEQISERVAGEVWNRRLQDGGTAGNRLAAIDTRTAKLLSRESVERVAQETGCDAGVLSDALAREFARRLAE